MKPSTYHNCKPWPRLEELFIKCRIRGECLEWQGTLDKAGYPILYRKGLAVKMHRYVYSKLNTKFDISNPKVVVRHLCNNPSCLRPEHLLHGSVQDNIADRQKSGRTQRGETHVDAKLTVKDVIRIRNIAATKLLKRVELARAFKVDSRTISSVILGHTWKHVTNDHKGQKQRR